MADYSDAAIAEHQAVRDLWFRRGRDKLVPLMTDRTGKPLLDPYGKTVVADLDREQGWVIYTTTDGSDVSFVVWPDHDTPVRVVELIDAAWTYRPEVRTLADVGAVLQDGGN